MGAQYRVVKLWAVAVMVVVTAWFLVVAVPVAAAAGPVREIAMIAGPATHSFGEHEHYAGLNLLAEMLNNGVPAVHATVYRDWPILQVHGGPCDMSKLSNVAAVVVYADGGPGGMLSTNISQLEPLMKRGVGLGVIHWALDVPKGVAGDRLVEWIGGCFETNWSVNPMWEARFNDVPGHPATAGVRPFRIRDEWYYHMRFKEEMRGIVPILTAVPPDDTRDFPDGPYSGNSVVRSQKGQPEHLAWVFEREGGGRGFGFAGGHKVWNFAQDDYRKLLLNAIVWISGAEIPPGGVKSERPGFNRMLESLEKPPPKFNAKYFEKMLGDLNAAPVESPKRE